MIWVRQNSQDCTFRTVSGGSLKHATTVDSVQYLQQLEACKQTLQILYSIWRLLEACKQTLQILYSLKHANTDSVQYLEQLEAGKHSRFCAVFVLYSIWRQLEACSKHCRFCTVSGAAWSMQTNTADSVQLEACTQALQILYSIWRHTNTAGSEKAVWLHDDLPYSHDTMTMICNDKNTSKVTLTPRKHYKKEEEKESRALVLNKSRVSSTVGAKVHSGGQLSRKLWRITRKPPTWPALTTHYKATKQAVKWHTPLYDAYMITRKSSKVTSHIFMKYHMIAKKKKKAERWSVPFSWHLTRTSLRRYPILMTPYKNIWGIIPFSWHLTRISLRHYPILMTPYKNISEALSHSHDT